MANFEKIRATLAEINERAKRAHEFGAMKKARELDKAGKVNEAFKVVQEYNEQKRRDNINADEARALCLNVAHLVLVEVLPLAGDIWNSYAGKRIGDKTRDKIRNQARTLAESAGLDYIIFNNDGIAFRFHYTTQIYYNFNGDADGSGAGYFDFAVYHDNAGDRLRLYDDEGRAQKIAVNNAVIHTRYKHYINDIPAFIQEANDAREEIKRLEESLREARHRASAKFRDIFDPWNI